MFRLSRPKMGMFRLSQFSKLKIIVKFFRKPEQHSSAYQEKALKLSGGSPLQWNYQREDPQFFEEVVDNSENQKRKIHWKISFLKTTFGYPGQSLQYLFRPTQPTFGMFQPSRPGLDMYWLNPSCLRFNDVRPKKNYFDQIRPRKNVSTEFDLFFDFARSLFWLTRLMFRLCRLMFRLSRTKMCMLQLCSTYVSTFSTSK